MTRTSLGFTLAESLVALALMLLVASAVVVLAASTDRLARMQSRVMDAQQRARVLAETLGRDLRRVGAGVDRGPMSGPLVHVFSPLWPRRVGRIRPDGVAVARADAITLVHVPDTVVQTTLAESGGGVSGRLVLSPCVGGALACRVARGTTIALFEPPGRVELLGVLANESGSLSVRPLGPPAGVFDAGSTVAEVVIRSYYFDQAAAQLRYYDGDGTDQSVVDAVSALGFEYFGDPGPPRWPHPSPGEGNCLYTGSGIWRGGVTLQADSDGLAALPLAMFMDGPWCSAGGTEFDADLLRVRRVRVVARLRVSGPPDPQPDYQVVFDVSPPNLALGGVPGGSGPRW